MKTLKQLLQEKNLGNIYKHESTIIIEALSAVEEWLTQKRQEYDNNIETLSLIKLGKYNESLSLNETIRIIQAFDKLLEELNQQ